MPKPSRAPLKSPNTVKEEDCLTDAVPSTEQQPVGPEQTLAGMSSPPKARMEMTQTPLPSSTIRNKDACLTKTFPSAKHEPAELEKMRPDRSSPPKARMKPMKAARTS